MDTSRIDTKLDKIQEDIGEIKVTLGKNTASLEEHMRRTEALEKRVESLWSKALLVVSLLGGVLTVAKALIN
jgi:hypothetical protein